MKYRGKGQRKGGEEQRIPNSYPKFQIKIKPLALIMFQVGLWIDAGSRFETEKNNGVAHFLEHMAFKVCPCLNLSVGEKYFLEV